MMRTLPRGVLAAWLAVLLAYPAAAGGQTTVVRADKREVQAAGKAADALRRPVTLDVVDARLGDVLAQISTQADLAMIYGADIVPVDRRVTVRFRALPAADALRRVLAGTEIDVVPAGPDRAILARRVAPAEPPAPAPAQTGAVAGRITEAATGIPVAAAEVWLQGTRWRTLTSADGRYLIQEVTPGEYTLRVRRLGYEEARQTVVVEADTITQADFALQSVPTELDAVVVTVTGEQRVRELGHVVGRIDADSLVRAAPISSVSELLTARVPGLRVSTHSGSVGGNVVLQLRSPSSLMLETEPIVIVDGVRYHSAAGPSLAGMFGVEPTSRLNDLSPNDIESIEIVKGPSAATLYGTDAANGVIVITTKRGRPGPARWNAYVRAAQSEIRSSRFPDLWWGWGSPSSSCTLVNVAAGSCTQDSVGVIRNPLNDSDQTIFAPKPTWQYGLNVAGGSESFRYYLAGDYEHAVGPIQMPPAVARELRAARGGAAIPEEQLEPNSMSRLNLRANVDAPLGALANVQLQAAYARTAARNMSLQLNGGAYRSSVLGTPEDPWPATSGPGSLFAWTSTERTDRFLGSARTEWRPLSWLRARGTVGFDLASSQRYSLRRRGEGSPTGGTGAAGDERTRQLAISADLGVTATARVGRLSLRTSAGTQYNRTLTDGLSATGSSLPPGGESPGQASSQRVSQSYNEAVTLGTYIEEVVGLNDRLFVSGALRLDGGSAFGRDYDVAAYPKASVSWLVTEEPFVPRVPGLDELRLRWAFGASGQQPRGTMSRPRFQSTLPTILDGQITNRVFVLSIGNPNLRPERVREHEFGLDLSGLGGRAQLALTWFRRRTVDQIVTRPLAPGFGSWYTNLGLVKGKGFELELDALLLKTRPVTLDVLVTHSEHRSLLAELGDAANPFETTPFGDREGYPLGARFILPITGYEDANGNGIIEPGEVQRSDTAVYVGESTPPRSQTLGTVVGLFDQRVRLSALFERRSGFTQFNDLYTELCDDFRCRAAVDPTAPLAAQAEAVAMQVWGTPRVERGDFTRLREVAIGADLPASWSRRAGVRSASVSLAARNVALWTSFSGPDPESAPVVRYIGQSADRVPQARVWVVRFDLGF